MIEEGNKMSGTFRERLQNPCNSCNVVTIGVWRGFQRFQGCNSVTT